MAVNAADLQLPSVPLSRTGRGARLSYVALRRLVVTALECEHERAAASIADRPTVCQSRSNEGNNQLRSLAERTACHGNNQLRLQCGGWLTPASVAVNAADLQREHEQAAASIADRPTACQSRSNQGNNQLRPTACQSGSNEDNNQLRRSLQTDRLPVRAGRIRATTSSVRLQSGLPVTATTSSVCSAAAGSHLRRWQ